MPSRLSAVAARRSTLALLVSRDLKVKYADSVLGYLWSVLDPLLMAFVYWFVFTQIFRREVGHEPYIVFLLAGLLPWNWANGVMNDSVRALTSEAKLVRSTNLEREIWVLRIVASKGAEFVLSLPVIVGFTLVLRGQGELGLSPYLLTLPLAVALQALLLTGIALVLAPVTVLFRDVGRLVRIVTRVLFYLSPVIYGYGDVPERFRWVSALNPLTGIIELYRAALFPGPFPGWGVVAVSAAISLGVLALGAWVFARLEGPVLKEI